ncbi:MAG: DUF4213 domain-containing protein [Bacteroidales bacterium]|nr:DUF4213 domain-containing protein [Bacteroidales bacterium]
MKRQFVKSLCAFCTGVMTLVAASSLVVSCYDDSALREDLEEMKGELSELDARLQAIEALKDQLTALTARVDALYTLQFQVSDNNELQYSFDGKDWKGTGIILAEECDAPCECVPVDPCSCPEVSLVDNGDSVTIKVGDAEFTIEKPQEIVFEIRAGKLYFESEGTQTVAVKTVGIEDLTVMAAPKGWWAEINSDGQLVITAPDYESTQGDIDYETWEEIPAENAASGYVKVHACGADGKCMVGKVAVEVAAQALIVKAYGGNAYFTLVANYAPTFYYGISTKETLEADTKDLLKRMNDGDWNLADDYDNNWGEFSVTESIADLLGEEPKLGEEYVVWAVLESWSAAPFDMDDLVYAYYSPLQVKITEVEAERTAYNVTVDVEVIGADSYVAVAMPQTYCSTEDDVLYQQEMMAMAMAQGEYYGKLYKENYHGSALDIAAETTYSMTGNYSPASDIYVFVLPLDGRSNEDYTLEDVVVGKFATAGLTSGGSVNVTATQIYEYMGTGYDENWNLIEKLFKLDPYTEVGVEVTPSSTSGWSAFYYQFLTEEQWADYGAYDEDLVDLLLEGWGMTPTDVEKWPQYITEKVNPATTVHFVAFFVDKDGKYGELAKVKLTSEELKKAEISWVEPYTTNLVDGSLKNTKSLEFTPVTEGEAASYKYVWQATTYYNPYKGKDDAQMAEEIFFSSSAKTVTAADLVDGKIVIEGHRYGDSYYFAVLPLDANGAPGNSAAILEYTCDFSLDNVITEGADYTATEPGIVINLPEWSELYTNGDWGEGSYYGWEDQTAWGYGYRFYYEFNYSVAPKEGTEVSAMLVNADDWTLGSDAKTRASQLLQESFGTPFTTTVAEDALYTYFQNYNDKPAPEVYLMVVWSDAAGNYYYKEYALQSELQKYADKLSETLGLEKPELPTPDGKQWSFNWTAMGMGDLMAVLDFGVSMEGQCLVAIDPSVLGAPEGSPYQIFNAIGYEFEPADATSGKLTLITVNMYGEELTQEFKYYDLTDYSCYFEFGEDSFILQDVDGLLTEVEIDMSGGIMQ